MNLLKYSNGWGHLIMSLASLAAGVFLTIYGNSMYAASGIGLIGLVTSAWFVSGAAKQVATEVNSQASVTAAAQVVQNAAVQTAVQSAVQTAVQSATPAGGTDGK